MYYIKTSLEGRVLHHNLHYSTELFLLKHKQTNKPTNQPKKLTTKNRPKARNQARWFLRTGSVASGPDAFGQTLTRPSRSDLSQFSTIWSMPCHLWKTELKWMWEVGSGICYPARFWLHAGRNSHNWLWPKHFRIRSGLFAGIYIYIYSTATNTSTTCYEATLLWSQVLVMDPIFGMLLKAHILELALVNMLVQIS